MAGKYDLITHLGIPTDVYTARAIDAGLGLIPDSIRRRIRFTQGAPSYFDKSAGTHSGRGAFDLIIDNGTVAEYRIVENAFRRVGWAAWFREAIEGVWPRHVHGVLKGHSKLAYQAYLQVLSFGRGNNGLKGDGRDVNPYHPTIVFNYKETDVPLSDKDVQRIAQATAKQILTYPLRGDKENDIPAESVSQRLLRTRSASRRTLDSLTPGVEGQRPDGAVYGLLRRAVRKLGA